MPQSTPSCLYLATTRSCFKVGGRQHASTRRIVTCIFRLQHRREQQINALVLWHASRLEQADSGGEVDVWTDAERNTPRAQRCTHAPRAARAAKSSQDSKKELRRNP